MNSKVVLVVSYVTVLSIFFSCQMKEKEYYENGQLSKEYFLNKEGKIEGEYLEYYQSGNIKIKEKYSNGILVDSSKYYDEIGNIVQVKIPIKKDVLLCKTYNASTGKIEFEGYILDNRKFGKWKYFDEKGNIKQLFKYIDSCGVDYMNESWYYDKMGELIKSKSNFIEIENLKKAYKNNESIEIKFIYNPILNEDASSFLCISPKIDSNFCNLKQVKLDTLFSNNNQFNFNVRFKKQGVKNLRGFVEEFYYDKNINKTGTRKVYFDIPVVIE